MSKQQITGGILLHMILTKIETKNTKQFHQNNPWLSWNMKSSIMFLCTDDISISDRYVDKGNSM